MNAQNSSKAVRATRLIRRINLRKDHWDALQLLAEQTGSRRKVGPQRLQPAIEVLMQRIAEGEVELVDTKPNRPLHRIDAALTALQMPPDIGPKQEQQKYNQMSMLELA
jgi:hypothetical protein